MVAKTLSQARIHVAYVLRLDAKSVLGLCDPSYNGSWLGLQKFHYIIWLLLDSVYAYLLYLRRTDTLAVVRRVDRRAMLMTRFARLRVEQVRSVKGYEWNTLCSLTDLAWSSHTKKTSLLWCAYCFWGNACNPLACAAEVKAAFSEIMACMKFYIQFILLLFFLLLHALPFGPPVPAPFPSQCLSSTSVWPSHRCHQRASIWHQTLLLRTGRAVIYW